MEKVRLGIVGYGNMGSSHTRSIMAGKNPEIELTAIAEINPQKLELVKETAPDVELFNTATEMFDSGLVDAVIIATPHYAHPSLVIEALGKGLHVMTEKPAGVYTKQVREMNEAAAKSDKIFGIMFNQRTNHVYRKMRELIKSGEYGEIKRVNWIITDWFRTQAYYNSGGWRATWNGEGGGVLLNQCPHNLDLWQWICGMPTKVRAFCYEGKWHNIEVEDDVTIYVEYPNGATGLFIATTGDCPGTNRFEVTLEKGKIVCEGNELKVYRLEENCKDYIEKSVEGFASPRGEYIDVETDGLNEQHSGVLNAFAGAILHGDKNDLVAKGEEGINSLTISNAAYLSSWLGEDIILPIDEDLYFKKLNEKIEASTFKKEDIKETVEKNMDSTFGS